MMPVFPMNLSIASRDIRAASSCAKLIFFYITKETNKNHRGQVNRPERVNQGTCPCDPISNGTEIFFEFLLSFRRIFVPLSRVVCQSREIDEKTVRNFWLLNSQTNCNTEKERRANIATLEWALYAQTSTYVVMGCCRPVWEYGEVCAFFIPISLVLTFPSWER